MYFRFFFESMLLNNDFITTKIKEGDHTFFSFIFREYYVPLCVYAKRYVSRNDIAEEIVSDTFLNIWKNRSDIKIQTSLKSYLFQAVHNNSLYYIRKLKREKLINDFSVFQCFVDEISQKSLIYQEISEKIEDIINTLPPQQQTVFRLKRLEDKKIKEIAEIMNISVKTVEMHLSKAMVSLRNSLKNYFIILLLFFHIIT